jgi:hypothetical protein
VQQQQQQQQQQLVVLQARASKGDMLGELAAVMLTVGHAVLISFHHCWCSDC